jgi:peroxiredoxin
MWKSILRLITGGNSMAAIPSGRKAPEFTLKGPDGKPHSLSEALARGPALLAFFKVSCPVCQFTFPFIERLHDAYGEDRITIWGISQDDASDTADFCKEFDLTFPMLLDGHGFPASNQYGLTNVPSLFLIGTDGNIRISSVGFAKAELEGMARELAAASHRPAIPLFHPGEIVPVNKPG